MKRLKQFAAAVFMSLAMTVTSFAGQWVQDYSGWWYQNDDGSYPANGWQWIDGNHDGIAENYYFDANGYCLMNTMTPDGNMVDANGAWVMGGVVQTQVVGWPETVQGGLNSQQNTNTAGYGNTDVHAGTSQETANQSAGTQQQYPVEAMVWLSATGSKYHRIPNCGRMNPSKARQVSLEQAVAQGFERCKNCY